MHCLICDNMLSNYESTRRHATTKAFLDLCSPCLRSIDSEASMPHVDRKDLMTLVDIEESLDNEDESCYPSFRDYDET